MRHLTVPLALAFTLVIAGVAHGATVGDGQFVAAPGERNDVYVRAVQHGEEPFDLEWTITDRTAPLEASGACRGVDAHTVSCDGGISMAIALGDRDDTADFEFDGPVDGAPQMWVSVRGGLGDDTLRGGPGVNRLRGGAGDDRLIAGAPRSQRATGDLLFGGPGDDVLSGGPAARRPRSCAAAAATTPSTATAALTRSSTATAITPTPTCSTAVPASTP